MAIRSYAKINFFLKVGKRLSSGYHSIQSVMQRINLSDSLKIEPISDDKIIIECTNRDLEGDGNLAYKAAMILKSKFSIRSGARIFIEKTVPIQSGLGGASANAATALVALNKLWGLKLKEQQLSELALKIGSDVPFFINENAALVEGIGDKIKGVSKSFSINLVLINPGFGVPTKWAYSAFDRQEAKPKTKADIKALIKAIEKKDIKSIAANIHNDFEQVVAKKHKVINEIKNNLMKNDALNATISGSGPTVFGIFNSIYEARETFFKIQYDYPFVFLTKTI